MKVRIGLAMLVATMAVVLWSLDAPLARAGLTPYLTECVTVFGVDKCDGLEPPAWVPASCGTAYAFKNLWGKGKLPLGPKNAGVGYAGPVCWSGPPPQAGEFIPTTPGWQPDLDPLSKKNRDFEAVKALGPCCLCCFNASILINGSAK